MTLETETGVTLFRADCLPANNAMPTVTIRYRLPDEQAEYDAARIGRDACGCLWDIDQRLRGLLKHGEPSEETAKMAEEIRQMIRDTCPDALEL